jgi:hypothetical protein
VYKLVRLLQLFAVKAYYKHPTEPVINTITFTLQSLTEESIQQGATMVTECKPFVIVNHEAMWDVDVEALALLNALVQLLGSNITTHVTSLCSTTLVLGEPSDLWFLMWHHMVKKTL